MASHVQHVQRFIPAALRFGHAVGILGQDSASGAFSVRRINFSPAASTHTVWTIDIDDRDALGLLEARQSGAVRRCPFNAGTLQAAKLLYPTEQPLVSQRMGWDRVCALDAAHLIDDDTDMHVQVGVDDKNDLDLTEDLFHANSLTKVESPKQTEGQGYCKVQEQSSYQVARSGPGIAGMNTANDRQVNTKAWRQSRHGSDRKQCSNWLYRQTSFAGSAASAVINTSLCHTTLPS